MRLATAAERTPARQRTIRDAVLPNCGPSRKIALWRQSLVPPAGRREPEWHRPPAAAPRRLSASTGVAPRLLPVPRLFIHIPAAGHCLRHPCCCLLLSLRADALHFLHRILDRVARFNQHRHRRLQRQHPAPVRLDDLLQHRPSVRRRSPMRRSKATSPSSSPTPPATPKTRGSSGHRPGPTAPCSARSALSAGARSTPPTPPLSGSGATAPTANWRSFGSRT